MAVAHLRLLESERWRGLPVYEVTVDTCPDDAGPMPAAWSSFDADDDSDMRWSFMWQSEAERVECLAIDVAEGRRTFDAVMQDAGFQKYVRQIATRFREEEDVSDSASREDVIRLMVRRMWERRLLPTSDHSHYGLGVWMSSTKAALLALSRLPAPNWLRIIDQTKTKERVLVALPRWARMADIKSYLETGHITRAGQARKRAREKLRKLL
jgi:hypothetical protein